MNMDHSNTGRKYCHMTFINRKHKKRLTFPDLHAADSEQVACISVQPAP